MTNTFNSRKENIIRWSISYLEGLRNLNEKDKDGGNWKYAIIASTLWEVMIDSVLGNQSERDKTKYGKKHGFTDMRRRREVKTGKPTQHDSIYEDDEVLVIMDAKMYGYPMDHLLSEQVLGKQFGYYEQAILRMKRKTLLMFSYSHIIRSLIASIFKQGSFLILILPSRKTLTR